MADSDSFSSTPPPPTLELRDLTAASVIGRGARGVVFLACSRTSGETLALKAISRSAVSGEPGGSAYRRIWFERDALLALQHPLLPTLRGVVSTEKIIGFAMDHCPGGDLNSLRLRQTENMFSNDIILFYAAELVIVLDYLHELGIVYRDLKPENVLIQENGHIMVIDFDLSTKLPTALLRPQSPFQQPESTESKKNEKKKKKKKKFRQLLLCNCYSDNAGDPPENYDDSDLQQQSPTAKSNSFVGTEDYVAPEIITGTGHDFAVDWWCLGVMLYEMLYGRTPFRGQNRKETFYRILTKTPELVGESTALRDLIGRLLEKDPKRRIAGEEIRRHEFFRGVDWESVVYVARPPFIPAAAEWKEGIEEGLNVERIVEEISADARSPKRKVSEGHHAQGVRNCAKTGEFDIIKIIFVKFNFYN
ncbi:Serine/threonine-protein kinase OXI1 [Apostasia shenzhenica]|uniref:non-specific serine/threonine protein kinase n=1 Tax=Apostasia shenzhenica TaxID=1088818 RepID=A0A2I0BFU0_9ASPA|nr:Serine/threonine-protein kinase OXI1 [Apostasia shenzhenica]